MTDIYDGDPFIALGGDGADMIFKGGQPVMDAGMVNHVNISLLTEPGWWGNDIEPVAERRPSSKFLPTSRQPVTRQSIIDTEKAAASDLAGDEFGKLTATVRNPSANNLDLSLLLEPPRGQFIDLQLTRVGANWINQKNDPAGKKETS